MPYVRNEYKSQLDKIKDDIKRSYQYFRQNYQRYHQFITFIYKTSISPADQSVLLELQKPEVEFNVLEAYISRLCGEFSKMDPSFSVRVSDGVQLTDPRIIEVVEAHMKACFQGGDKDSLSYQIYKDLLAGGFSVVQIYTDYASNKSFDQKIYIERVFDPTLCGFDPLARESHKGDGQYAFQCFPKTVAEAIALYGSSVLEGTDFGRSSDLEDFNWSYRNQDEDIMLFAEYFKKKRKKQKIVKLSNGHVVPEKEYEAFLEKWQDAGIIPQAPIVVQSRMSYVETIEKFTVCGTQIVEHAETNFSYLPLVFFDGNSIIIRDNDQSQAEQMTRPYVYQARDAQKMKNFAGQTLCNEIENLVQHKWTAPIEGIPDNQDYQYAYTYPQKATILLYNSFKDNDPKTPLAPPREVARVPIPPEISNTFAMSDQVIQSVLGSYDASQGILEGDMSGVAIMQGAMHSNAAAMPYTMGFIQGWNRCGQIYLDLLPKYYVTPRTIPIIKKDGKRDYYEINKPGNVSFNYDTNCLEVKVEAGVNFAVQKQMALKTILGLMQASEQFAAFINTEGLEILLDNIDIKGVDSLKAMAAQFMQQQKQMQQQAMQAQQQAPNPAEMQKIALQMEQMKLQIEQMKIAQKQKEAELKAQVSLTEIATDNATKSKEADIKFMEVMSRLQNQNVDQALKQEKVDAEKARAAVDMAISLSSHHHELMEKEKQHATEERPEAGE